MYNRKLLVFILLTTLVCISLIPVNVFAEDVPNYVDLNKSSVLSDLTGSTINGKPFDVNNYPIVKERELQLINLLEFGYSDKDFRQYGLYVYLYNPKQIDFATNDTANDISFGVTNAKKECTSYVKYPLVFISKSNDNVFYKFKIKLPDDWKDKLDAACRKYCIAGIELMSQSDNVATDYNIAKTYSYRGYGKSFGPVEESTLSCSVTNLEVIQLDVKSLEYKTKAKTNNHLHSVCFSVPNKILKKYGTLSKVECEWYEYETNPIVVTWNKPNGLSRENYYDRVSPYIGKAADANAPEFGTGWYSAGTQMNPYAKYDWCYNPYNGASGYGRTEYNSSTKNLYYLFNSGNKNPMEYDVSADDVMSYIYNYDKSYKYGNLEIKRGNISADLFTSNIKQGRTRGYNHVVIDASGQDNLFTTTNDNWWNKLWGTHTEVGAGVRPLEKVHSANFSDVEFMDKYKLNKRSCTTLKDEVNKAKTSDKSTYIMRIGVTDFDSEPIYFGTSDKAGYVAKETVFLDFDIITLTFENEGDEVIMPVVSSPIDITGDVTHPEEPNRGIDKIIKILLMVLAIILLIIILMPVIPYIIQFLLWVLLLPIRLIQAIVRAFKKKE